jgi:predicted GIY-YIG superfamily endonuclease
MARRIDPPAAPPCDTRPTHARRKSPWGVIYILRFERPLGNPHKRKGLAQFYIGWCELGRINKRLREHRQGRGAKITQAFAKEKIGFELVVCFSGTRDDERRVKRYGNTRLFVERRGWEPPYRKTQTVPF